jgi:hypothetical protein
MKGVFLLKFPLSLQDSEARHADGLGFCDALAGFEAATQVAGAVGIEPTTFGFGDRRSAN